MSEVRRDMETDVSGRDGSTWVCVGQATNTGAITVGWNVEETAAELIEQFTAKYGPPAVDAVTPSDLPCPPGFVMVLHGVAE